jgi:GTP-binding protein YchF
MSISLGIVGLPNVGKSTLFNALTAAQAPVSNYPFCTINPNVAVVAVPDPRLEEVQTFMRSPQNIPTVIEFHDIAGLVKNAHQGEGLGNQFLSHIRNVDAILQVVRCFSDPNVVHVYASVDPLRDIEVVNTELLLADLALVEKKLQSAKSAAKTGEKPRVKEKDFYERLKQHLEQGKPARKLEVQAEEEIWLRDLFLLTSKPMLYAANVAEVPEGQWVAKVEDLAKREGAGLLTISARLEVELKALSPSERKEYLEALEGSPRAAGLEALIQASYKLLRLLTFFTANEKEARAWTLREGTTAQRAAGRIHSDFEKGFISAEVLHYRDLKKCENHTSAKEKGLLHLQGKDYLVQDGDLVYFHFNL